MVPCAYGAQRSFGWSTMSATWGISSCWGHRRGKSTFGNSCGRSGCSILRRKRNSLTSTGMGACSPTCSAGRGTILGSRFASSRCGMSMIHLRRGGPCNGSWICFEFGDSTERRQQAFLRGTERLAELPPGRRTLSRLLVGMADHTRPEIRAKAAASMRRALPIPIGTQGAGDPATKHSESTESVYRGRGIRGHF